ncbi:MAG: helicase-related protein [Syntrophorhabdales bacterium]
MIDLRAAEKLLDFGARIGEGARAQEQLEGAVAMHNVLERYRVAYLADEVGMGKTYVALGALALFRHYDPDFRVLVIAPRENIQYKWKKEFSNFVAHNIRFPDLRVRSIDGRPSRPMVTCDNLMEFVHEVVRDPRSDFFLRLTSFSLPLGYKSESWRRLWDDLRRSVPWMPYEPPDLRDKDVFKENFARAVCCVIPEFDLVIFDEGHNIKHGYTEGASARNRVLALVFGHPSDREGKRAFPNYGPKAKRVLFLSATPVEESYRHIWNQLDVFGLGEPFSGLCRDDLTEKEKKEIVRKFLIRRVTTVRTGGCELTKNQYRREWRAGGVKRHDDPMTLDDDRQRLVVALVQKKVAELLGSEKFNRSFQIGMLASFESFLETARLKRDENDNGTSNFYDTEKEQTEDLNEREGIDVYEVNRLSDSYRKWFGHEMPHPKMDAVVESLSQAWKRGEKTLIFVRRVASVKELKRKLDECYDDWLIPSLRGRLPVGARGRFDQAVRQYREEKRDAEAARVRQLAVPAGQEVEATEENVDDRGGTDTFFAWFFRGTGPRGVVSGANVQRRFIQRGTVYATFFEDNHVADLLMAEPGNIMASLAKALKMEPKGLREELRRRACRFLSRAKKHPSADRLEAAQAAAIEMLKDLPGELGRRALVVWQERYSNSFKLLHAIEGPDVSDRLEQVTFFTELRRPYREELRAALWPEPKGRMGREGFRERFRERELRAQLLATTARLGHALIDLYVLTIQRLGRLDQRTFEKSGEDDVELDRRRIDEYLDMLDGQRNRDRGVPIWTAYDELADVARNFELIMDVNAPDARTMPLSETASYFGSILRQQQPVGGMSGQVNKTLVQQFRMPGYPLVLVTTDLLKEGEDLHTFCSSIHHYGITWTSSSMEQRVGRIDRVRSQTDRRLEALACAPAGDELMQVYFPYLEDSVEVLQVQRVLERMNVFLRLMHEDLSTPKEEPNRIDVEKEILCGRHIVDAIRERLRSSFPVREFMLRGTTTRLAVKDGAAKAILDRLHLLTTADYGEMKVEWGPPNGNGKLMGTVTLPDGQVRRFDLLLGLDKERLVLRCVSRVGGVNIGPAMNKMAETVNTYRIRLGAVPSRDERSHDLSVEEDVLLEGRDTDALRVGMLLARVAQQADVLEKIHIAGQDQLPGIFEDDPEEQERDGF